MDFNSIIDGVLSNWLTKLLEQLLAPLIASGVVAWIYKKRTAWAPIALPVVVTFCSVLVVVIAFNIQLHLDRMGSNIVDTSTPQAVERSVRKWLEEDLKVSVTLFPQQPNMDFAIGVNQTQGPMVVSKQKIGVTSNYIMFEMTNASTDQDTKVFDELAKRKLLDGLIDDLMVEAARNGNEATYNRRPLSVTMVRRLPIVALTEESFIDSMVRLNSTAIMLRRIVDKNVKSNALK